MEIKRKLNKLDIYKRFNFMKPFIGKFYKASNIKLLMIGESHYLPEADKAERYRETWYSAPGIADNLSEKAKKWVTPRYIIGEDFMENPTNKPFSIYKNTAECLRDVHQLSNVPEAINHLSYYNYFLRPAEVTGKSIRAHSKDKILAYEHFLNLLEILQPKKVVFVSTLAFNSFKKQHNSHRSKEGFVIPKSMKNTLITRTCHPGSAWWNKKSKKYAFAGSGPITGKERFIKIIQY